MFTSSKGIKLNLARSVCLCYRLRLRCSCEPVLWVNLFCRCYKFYLLIIVGRSFTSNNACKEWNRIIFYQRELAVNILKIKTAADEGGLGRVEADGNVGGGLIKIECPFKSRITYLINDFSQLTTTVLKTALRRLKMPFQGPHIWKSPGEECLWTPWNLTPSALGIYPQ